MAEAQELINAIGGGGSGSVTSVDVSGGTTGLTTSGGPVTSTGVITIAGTLNTSHGGTGLSGLSGNSILAEDAGGGIIELSFGVVGSAFVGKGLLSSPGFAVFTGDVILNDGNGAMLITNHAVSYAKIQQASTHTLLGNPTGSTANVQEITLGTGLSFSGSVLNSTGGGITGPGTTVVGDILTWGDTAGATVLDSGFLIVEEFV